MSYLSHEETFRLLFNEFLENHDSNGFTIEVSKKESPFQAGLASSLMSGMEDYEKNYIFSGVT